MIKVITKEQLIEEIRKVTQRGWVKSVKKTRNVRNDGAVGNHAREVAAHESAADVLFPVTVAVAEKGILAKSIVTNGMLRARREVELLVRVGGELIFWRGT